MTVDFADYFWGEKNNGFDVLYHNMKHGVLASKELTEFLRERSVIEENNYKLLSKVAKQASNSNSTQGTFAPVWAALRTAAEKLAGLHLQLAQKVAEIIKDVSKYSDELHKKHKAVKEEESSTLEVVQSIQSVTVTLQKAKDICMQRGLELEKLKKDTASQRELEKAEVKFKKAQDDYKTLVDKYTTIRNDFELKMTQACRRFQDVEEMHLRSMKEFLNTYADVLQANHEQVGQVHIDFKRQCLDMTVEKLLEQFVQSKYTGFEKPGVIEYDEVLSSIAEIANQSGQEKNSEAPKEISKGANGETGVAGFLRSRREKRKEKKAKKKKDSVESTSNKEDKSDLEDKEQDSMGGGKSATSTPTGATAEVDEDGYCIKPAPQPDSPWDNSRDNFYSSSDSDSDSTETRERKLRVEIKPLGCNGGTGPISASVDELRATVEGLSLGGPPRRGSTHEGPPAGRAPPAPEPPPQATLGTMKRSQSVSQQLPGQPDGLLLGLLGSRNALVSPPPARSPRFPDAEPFGDAAVPEAPALPPKLQQLGTIALPRPPSRRGDAVRGRLSPAAAPTSGSPSPATISRADSAASLEFRGAGATAGASRGPSPLTIGLADSVPLAVAFHEIAHAYFRGSDETRCQVKLVGDMMLSFPAGIVGVLASHPCPARLSFRLRNSTRLERLVPNSQLVSAAASDSSCFEFNMSALTALLRRQAELNPHASYFNVDILKYQVRAREGAASCPLQLVAYWKCNPGHTDLKVDYKYNSRAMAAANPLLNVQLSVPIDGGFKSVQSQPNAQWLPESNRLIWKFTELSQHSEGAGIGSLKARVELSNGPGNQGTIFTQFNCEGATLSGVDFDLAGPGYRVSLVKKRFISGKYLCDGDVDLRTRYAAPPNIE